MPDHPQAVVTYPGILSVVGGTFTTGHGETPGVWALDIAPQSHPPDEFGSVTISYNGTTAEFKDCRVVEGSLRRNSSGHVIGLVIEDWRWQWRDRGAISGRYNERNPDGTVVDFPADGDPVTIADRCFQEAGQSNCDTSALAEFSDVKPYINWEAVNPARALSDLCEMFGCRIAPKLDNLAEIVKLGEGPELSEVDLIDITEKVASADRPHALRVVGGPSEFEYDWELEAVALELDGSYVLLDDVSYKPEDGWTSDASTTFDNIADLTARSAAKKSVYRTFRIKLPDGGLELPGYTDVTDEKIERVEQLIFLNHQCQQVEQNGVKAFLPAMLYGAFEGTVTADNDVFGNNLDAPKPITDLESDMAKRCIYRGTFSFDAARRIVTTTQPLVLRDEDDMQGPAKLRLRVAVQVRDKDTGGVVRHYRERDYGYGPYSKPKILRHDEIVARAFPQFKEDDESFSVAGLTLEINEANKQADYYLDAEESTWQITRAAEATYAGIKWLMPSGVIRQVVWSFGNSRPATTRIGHNTEIVKYITPYPERRQNVQVRGLVEDAKFTDTATPASLESIAFGGDPISNPFTIPFRNDSGEIIPPYAVMRPNGDALNRDGNFAYRMVKPDDTFRRLYYVNGPTAIPVDGYGMCSDCSSATLVRVDSLTSSTSHRTTYGVEEDSWELKRGGVGDFMTLSGVVVFSDGNARLFRQSEIKSLVLYSEVARNPGADFTFQICDIDGPTNLTVPATLRIYPPGIGGDTPTYTSEWPEETAFIAQHTRDAATTYGLTEWVIVAGLSEGTPV